MPMSAADIESKRGKLVPPRYQKDICIETVVISRRLLAGPGVPAAANSPRMSIAINITKLHFNFTFITIADYK